MNFYRNYFIMAQQIDEPLKKNLNITNFYYLKKKKIKGLKNYSGSRHLCIFTEWITNYLSEHLK